jgi:anti-sigma-K factor RskA
VSGCPHRDDAGPWVLGALADDDARAFGTHLEGCEVCRAEVSALQPVADVLPMAAPQELPPPELKHRIMAVVESEAALLRAAGPDADRRSEAPPERSRERGWWRRPLPALALACTVLVLGVAVGLLVRGGGDDDTTTVPGFGPRGAQVALRVSGGRGQLDLHGMPQAPSGHVYQVWLVTGSEKPRATHALFSVPADGRARVEIPEALDGTDQVLVTAEPPSGSPQPTSTPIAGAKLT